MRKYTLALAGWLIVALGGCKLSEVTPAIEEEVTGYKEYFNQAYGADPVQKCDIYAPVTTGERPSEVLILLHGGAWGSGDKSFLIPSVMGLKGRNKNLTIVNANYRLTSSKGIRLEQQMADIQLLVEYLRKNADKYNITQEGFVIGGVSAGGHLALNYAYSNFSGVKLKGVVGIAAPTDLTSEPLREAGLELPIQQLIGKTFSDSPEEYQKASPFFIVNHKAPPLTMLFYGGKDRVVPKEQGEILCFKLNLLRLKYRYYFYPEETHDFTADLLIDKILSIY
ncbi:alpha/beta hydrolase [Runella aurantiaca]|uniref:Alpha/beta hydrolase n=1 Tax=Runella aurantiaca TaxID=2282308 RepID=A0A369IIG7_9BACT|nr:alpha/beta hydrolase [Runella aurantiaca]RDB07965.1 alpha/beta hydrolase [Runella aurantiaca]